MIVSFLVGTASDVAGEVIEVGPGVKNFKVGEKIVAMTNPRVIYCIYSFGLFLGLLNLKIFTLLVLCLGEE